MATKNRNSQLTPSVNRLSKSGLKAKKGYHTRLNKPAAEPKPVAEKAAPETKEKTIGGSKNGGTRTVNVKKGQFYPGDDSDLRRPKLSRKSNAKTPTQVKLRKSIQPGQILILVAGKFKGKRVVFLKQLKSGLLLVTGPYAVNGVPLRRINQAYAIATSTRVDLADAKVDEKFDDAYFVKSKAKRSRGSEAEFFKDGEKENPQDAEKKSARSADQKSIDKSLIAAIAKTPNLSKYLSASFALSKGELPHMMKF